MDSIKEFLNKIKDKIFGAKNDRTRKIAISLLFCLVILLILTVDMIPREMEFAVGQESPADIKAPESRTIIDERATRERQQLALENLSPIYQENRQALEEMRKKKNEIFAFLLEAREGEASLNEAEVFFADYDLIITEEQWEFLLGLSTAELAGLRLQLEEALSSLYQGPLYSDDQQYNRERFREIFAGLQVEEEKVDYLTDLFAPLLVANLEVDEEAVSEREQSILAGIEPVTMTVRSGELIVQQGQEITEQELQLLEEFGLSRGEISWFQITGIAFYFIIITLIIFYYFINYHEDIWQVNNQVFLLESLIIILFVIAWIISRFELEFLAYLAPVAMVSILATVLLKTAAAVAVTIYISLLLPVLFGGNFLLAASYFVAGMVGAFSVAEVSQRSDLVKAGFNVSGALVLTIMVLNFLNPAQLLLDYVIFAGIGLANGLLVAILANGLLPYLENGFDLTSAVKLLELSNPSHPLLKRLLVEAPGTYHHSVLVGNLAESAADQIGADSLLTRVAAYYHDIGKLKRPFFFSDNQFGDDNPHDEIKPNLSALIIRSHVRDGVELARKYNLPQEIIDIIEQHQGTNLISYFYQQAQQSETRSSLNESDFRYEGPKPQTKEAALIMLADVCEAAVRSKNFNKSNHSRIESVVRGLIREKLIENELDESNLTLKELNLIGESFSRILTGIYHQRVEYPEEVDEEMRRLKGGDSAGEGSDNKSGSGKNNQPGTEKGD